MATLDVIANTSARPASPSDGDMYFQADLQQIVLYDGTATAWKVYTPDAGPYDLDGTNVLSVTPRAHFDAGFINGVDATGNPVDGASFGASSEIWKSKNDPDNLYTKIQTTGSAQPVYKRDDGINAKPYFVTDTGDQLIIDIFRAKNNIGWLGEFTTVAFYNIINAENKYQGGGIGVVHAGTVANTTAIGTNKTIFWANNASAEYPYWSGFRSPGARPDINSIANPPRMAAHMMMCQRNSAGKTHYFFDGDHGGASDMEGTHTGEFVIMHLLHGRTFGQESNVYELMAFQGELSSADKNKLIDYFQAKYASTITGVSQASPAVITAANHHMHDDATVVISGVAGSPGAVNGTHLVTRVDDDNFSIPIDSTASAYTSGGTVQKFMTDF